MICSKCGKDSSSDETGLDTQEWLYYNDVGGYGSKIGDGSAWELVLCQECTQDIVGDYISILEYYY